MGTGMDFDDWYYSWDSLGEDAWPKLVGTNMFGRRPKAEAKRIPAEPRPFIGVRLMPTKDVISATGLSRPTINKLEIAGKFPKRKQITEQKIGWISTEIEQWIRSRPSVA